MGGAKLPRIIMSEELAGGNASTAELKEEVGVESELDINSIFADADSPDSVTTGQTEGEKQSEVEAELEQESEGEAEAEDEASEEALSEEEEKAEKDRDVLSKRGAKKAQQTIDKLTRLMHEQRESFEAQIKKLEEHNDAKQNQTASIEQQITSAKSADELDSLLEQAEDAIETAEDAIRFSDYEEFSEEECRAIIANSRSAKKLIRSRKKDIVKLDREKQQWTAKALESFPFLKEKESDEYRQVDAWLRNPEFKKAFEDNPKGIFFASLAAIGLKHYQNSSNSGAKKEEKPEPTKRAKETKPKTTQRAPRLPGVDSSAAGAPGGRFEQSKSNDISLPDRNFDESDLKNFFLQVDKTIKK